MRIENDLMNDQLSEYNISTLFLLQKHTEENPERISKVTHWLLQGKVSEGLEVLDNIENNITIIRIDLYVLFQVIIIYFYKLHSDNKYKYFIYAIIFSIY